jgi:hypothetical protein
MFGEHKSLRYYSCVSAYILPPIFPVVRLVYAGTLSYTLKVSKVLFWQGSLFHDSRHSSVLCNDHFRLHGYIYSCNSPTGNLKPSRILIDSVALILLKTLNATNSKRQTDRSLRNSNLPPPHDSLSVALLGRPLEGHRSRRSREHSVFLQQISEDSKISCFCYKF